MIVAANAWTAEPGSCPIFVTPACHPSRLLAILRTEEVDDWYTFDESRASGSEARNAVGCGVDETVAAFHVASGGMTTFFWVGR
jgi:hypothetical protein